jgi:hypothetical protein
MQVAAGKVKYKRTEAGRKLLKHYGKMLLFLNPDISVPPMIL